MDNDQRNDGQRFTKGLHQLIEAQALKLPSNIAITHAKKSLTYADLNQKSDLLATYLQGLGVQQGTLIGVYLQNSFDLVITLLGILKAGCVYVPLDPNFPPKRLEYIIQDSQAKIIITHSALKEKIDQLHCESSRIIYIDNDVGQVNKKIKNNKRWNKHYDTESLAYVIYTSGSTGKPKGVMISHRSLVNFLLYMQGKLNMSQGDRLLAVTTYCFDIAGLELFLPLLSGATCFLCNSEITKNADDLKNEIHQVQPTLMQATPATWNMLFQVGWENKENVRILCGGELLTESLKQAFLRTSKEAWNLYGPTETTIWSTIKRISENNSAANIGNPIANTDVLILNNKYNQVDKGEIGEICIGGAGLAKGYYNQPQLTEDKFIDHPIYPGKKIYRTGDLGRILDSDEIEFLGRMDQQVKIRGYRIELQEIENCLNQHPSVKDSVVVVKEQQGNKQLVAYVIIKDHQAYNPQELKAYLQENLPEYMVPSFIMYLDKLPLTPNLKVDRKLLAELQLDLSLQNTTHLRKSDLEQELLYIWRRVLNINFTDTNINFFDIGGNSVLAAVLVEEINKKLNLKLSVTNIFKYNSIIKICDYILSLNKEDNFNKKDIHKDKKTKNKLSNQDINDVAVIGMVGKFPMAEDLNEFWGNIIQGKNCIGEVPLERWSWQDIYGDSKKETSKTKVKWGGFIDGIKEFDPLFFDISPHEAERMDPQQRLLLTYTWLALENAGVPPKIFSKKPTGVFIAAGPNHYYDSLLSNEPDNNPYLITSTTPSMIPNRISHFFNLQGPSEIFEATCSSSFVALHRAIQSIQLGECEQAIVGAINLMLSPKRSIAYDSMGILSHDRNICSFQESANGYLRSEVVAVCVIKPLRQAMQDNDIIFCVIKGSSASHGGHGTSLTAPNQAGIETAMLQAYKKAQIDPRTVTYIEAHGTASLIGDSIEFEALRSAYQALLLENPQHNNLIPQCYLSSLKPCIGHSEVASGLASLFKAIMAINYKAIPGVPNFGEMNNKIELLGSPFKISSNNQPWPHQYDQEGNILPRRASINTYGFGVNAHVLIEEYLQEKSYNQVYTDSTNSIPELFILSAKTQDRLVATIRNFLSFIERNPSIPLSNIAYTLQVGRTHMKKRFACVSSSLEELKRYLREMLNNPNAANGENIYITTSDEKDDNSQAYSQEEIEVALKNRDLSYLSKAWIAGADINWENFSRDHTAYRIILPGYPFLNDEYWMSANKEANKQAIKKEEEISIKISPRKRICIIGAGPSGLVMAKSLIEEGHEPIIYEKQDRLGGIWNLRKDKISGVYKKTRFQNSKDTSFFSDFYPQDSQNMFLSEQEVREYLEEYSKKFNLTNLINFNSPVLSVKKGAQANWEVEILQSDQNIHENFDGIALCHGRYSNPFTPEILGLREFEGDILHSGQYYDNSIFKNKKVLIIGNGVSGMDIAEDAAETANEVIWCMRSLRLILPRMVGFLPNDFISPANLLVAGNNSGLLSRLKDSAPEYYNIYQKSGLFPKKEDFEEYPFIHINDNVVKLVATGKIKTIMGEIGQISRHDCIIKDTEELIKNVDTIVFCTGYNNNKNFDYIKDISVQNDFSMGLFYHKDPTLINSYGLNDVGTTGTFPYLEMVARWYAQIISENYQLSNEEINHRVDPKDIIVAPLANIMIGLKLGLLPNPNTSFKEFWRLIKYPSFSMIYRLIGPHSKFEVQDTLNQCIKRSLIPDEDKDQQLQICKYRILAGLDKTALTFLLENGEITEEDFNQAAYHIKDPILLDWNSQYIKRKYKNADPLSIQNNLSIPSTYKDENLQLFDKIGFQEKLIQIISETAKVDKDSIDEEDSLSSYGVSSVTLTLLADKISNTFPMLKLLPSTFIEYPTIGGLCSYLLSKYSSSNSTQKDIITVSNSPNSYIKTENINKEISLPEKSKIQDTEHFAHEDIAIIGIGGRFPGSNGLIDFWQKLIKGEPFVTKIPENRWDWEKFYGDPNETNKTDCCYGSFIKDIELFDNELFGISAEEAPFMDPQHRLVLEATWETLESAGYSKDSLSGKKIGFFIGIERQDYLHLIKEMGYPIDGYFNIGNSHSMLANHVSHFFGWTGLNTATDAACCSSFIALQQAINSLQIGQSEMAIAGGVHLLLSPDIYISNRKLGLFTNKAYVQPFDKEASGHYFGEGLGLLFLKKLTHAYRDNDNILGIIKGISVRHGGKGVYLTAPNVESHQEVIREALSQANLDPNDIDYIEAQGTGNPLADTAELKAYHNIFSKKNNGHVKVGTIKGHTGHLAGASGVLSLIKTIMSLKNNYITKIANFNALNWPSDEEKFSCEIANENMRWELEGTTNSMAPRRVGIHNFGFGGVVGHVILEESNSNSPNVIEYEKKELIALSAATKEQLSSMVASLYQYIENKEYSYFGYQNVLLRDIAYTLQIGRQPMQQRLVFLVGSLSELLKEMANFLQGNINKKSTSIGNIKDHKDIQKLFSAGEMQEIIDKWLSEGNLWQLGQLWVKGVSIDWKVYYNYQSVKKLVLPTYSFKRIRHWIDTTNNKSDKELKIINKNAHIEITNNDEHNLTHKDILEELSKLSEENDRLDLINNYFIELFSNILDVSQNDIDINDSLMTLGLDSLKWQMIRESIINEFDYVLSAAVLLENTTIGSIAKKIVKYLSNNPQKKGDNQAKLIQDASNLYEDFPLTDTQESFIVGRSLNSIEKIDAIIYLEIEESHLDIIKLKEAWNSLVQVHPMLRNKLSAINQNIQENLELGEIKVVDLSQIQEHEKQFQLNKIREQLAYKIYKEEDFPLFDMCVSKLSDINYIIHFSISELIADAESIKILLKQWYQLYNNFTSKIPSLNISFRDYVNYLKKLEKTDTFQTSLNYWVEKLATLPNGPSLPNVEVNKKISDVSIKRCRVIKKISKDIWEKLKKKSTENQNTSSILLFSIFTHILRTLSNSDHFSVILTTSGRMPVHPEIKSVVGPFLSTLLFEVNPISNKKFSEALLDYQRELWQSMDHNIVSGIRVLRELKKRSLFNKGTSLPVVFTSLLSSNDKDISVEISPWEKSLINKNSILLTPQIVFEHQCLENNGELHLIFDIAEHVYDRDKIDAALQNYEDLLEFIALNDNAFNLLENEIFKANDINKNTLTPLEDFKIYKSPENKFSSFQLSDMQNSYLFSRIVNQDTSCRSGQIYYEFEVNETDISKINMALNKVVQHHDILRAVVYENGQQQVLNNIHKYEIKQFDLSYLSAGKVEEEINRERLRHSKIVFPLAQWPFFEITASLLNNNKTILHATFDFLLYDMSSIELVFRDVKNIILNEDMALNKCDFTYRDYIISLEHYCKHENCQKALDYWAKKFSQISSGPQLPYNLSLAETINSKRKRHSLIIRDYKQLQRPKTNFAPLGMIVLTAYAEVLSNFLDTNPFTIVVVNWDRPEIHDSVNDIVGDFTRLSWLEYFPREDESFVNKLKYVYDCWLEDKKYSPVPGLRELRKRMRHRDKLVLQFPIVFTNFSLGIEDTVNFKQTKGGLSQTFGVYLDLVMELKMQDLIIHFDSVDDAFPDGFVDEFISHFSSFITSLSSELTFD